ncbi:DUF4190 domain-containing protein [Streptomyces sp. NPDC048629]|uniref:DUF4190 domain-containing protein n=1 Tax=Streptomyces sp. NPDC048629 TaxID=3154824 RepID=UPI00341E06D0
MEPSPPSPSPQQPWPAPVPYGAGPYAQPRQESSGLAVASLVAGIVCCLPPLGLVLGVLALVRIKKKGQTGKGLAVAGIVLSVISSLLLVVGLASGGFGQALDAFERGVDRAAAARSVFTVKKGECFDTRGRRTVGVTTRVEVVDCAEKHIGEVSGSFRLSGYDTYPGEETVRTVAWDRCHRTSAEYALDTWAIQGRLWPYVYWPDKKSWGTGRRQVTCALVAVGGGSEKVTGSVRSDATMLTADQVYFLRTVNAIDDALYEEPGEEAELAEEKAWAGSVAASIRGACVGLRAHHWPGDSTASVDGLVKELLASAKEWDRLAAAKDDDAFWERYDLPFDAMPQDASSRARTALGLTGLPTSRRTV